MLKQQDVLVLVKLLALDLRSEKWQYSSLSKSLAADRVEDPPTCRRTSR